MKRGFVTNELLIVAALFVILIAVSLPISRYIGWGTLGAFPLSLIGFVIVFCLLNAREILDQFRARSSKRTIDSQVQTDMEIKAMDWLDPWWSTEDKDAEFHTQFTRELEAEIGPGHPLHGIETRLVARGNGDDALFELLDGTGRYAVVHLTWARHPEPLPWPVTEMYNSFETFLTERMIPEHAEMEP